MICAKIYVDDGGVLVFDTVAHSLHRDGLSVSLSEMREDFFGHPYRVPRSTVSPTSAILCSPEAAALMETVFSPENPRLAVSRFDGDFEFGALGNGEHAEDCFFAFRPDALGVTCRHLSPTDRFTVCIAHGVNYAALSHLTLADNETVKQLALCEPCRKSDLPLLKK